MPRTKNHGSSEPKRRSRTGCWPCKSRKVKCGEEHPSCQNCVRTGDTCDYRIRLNWEGRRIKRRNASDADAEDSFPSETMFVNEFPDPCSSAADSIGLPLQRHATEPSTTGTGLRHYEFEHTLFQDLHQNPDMILPTVVKKKKAKSMDDSYTLDRPLRDIQIQGGTNDDWSSSTQREAQSPTTSASTSDENNPMQAANGDTQAESYYLEQANSPTDCQWPVADAAWNLGAPLNYMDSTVAQQSELASCTSEEVAHQSTWKDSLAVEASDRKSSVDAGATDSVECPPPPPPPLPPPFMTQVGHGSNTTCSVTWPTTEQSCLKASNDTDPTKMDIDDPAAAATITQAPIENQSPAWATRSDYQHILGFTPKAITIAPEKLQDGINMGFFDHFVNHTAKVLAPYHSKDANPFSTTLPELAFRSEILMSLVLAFSAAHKAQVLRNTEPDIRVAEWAEDIFPTLRQNLSDTTKAVPLDVLAAMVLLTSLEKSSPNAFFHSIPWQKHLSLSRTLMSKRIEEFYDQDKNNEDFSFTWRWFLYLDVMGQLSVGESESEIPSQTGPFDLISKIGVEDEDEFDCSMGFTIRCARLLAELAAQIRRCQRLSGMGAAEEDDAAIIEAALDLEAKFEESMKKPLVGCRHIRKNKYHMRDLTEMDSASEAFHWAGIVCLRRRILRKPSTDDQVQDGVQRIWECIQHIRREKEADTACVFPLFIAGCETEDTAQRRLILARLKSAEKSGMKQVKRARKLMEASWREKQPWFSLIQGEFLG